VKVSATAAQPAATGLTDAAALFGPF